MIRRLRPALVRAAARGGIDGPVDVLNLITTDQRRFAAYRWYGLLVAPAMRLAGGRPVWMSAHERALLGDPVADKLLVVRYPSHRRFLAMVLNPYYIAINELRERGVTRFEASFTRTSADAGIGEHRRLLVVHFRSRPGEDALAAITATVGATLVYASRAVRSIVLLDPPAPTDPNPLSLPQTACFALDGGTPDVSALAGLADEVSAQVYRREHPAAYLPPAVRAVLRRETKVAAI